MISSIKLVAIIGAGITGLAAVNAGACPVTVYAASGQGVSGFNCGRHRRFIQLTFNGLFLKLPSS